MPFPTVTVPQFPNVPQAPGVPAVLRSAVAAADSFTGSIRGVIDGVSGTFSGQIQGFLTDVNGATFPVIDTVRGAIDTLNNVSATINQLGSLVGQIQGEVDRVTGVIKGTVAGAVKLFKSFSPSAKLSDANGATDSKQSKAFQWGVFTSGGAPVLTGDNVLAVNYSRDFRVATFPVERGSFESYNKVEQPIDLMLTFTQGGTVADRASFLAACDIAQTSLELYAVATPEATYTEMNVVHISYDRTAASGATLLRVDVGLQRIRAYATATFTNTKEPAGATDVNAGPVQATPATPAQNEAVTRSLAHDPGHSA